MKEEKEFLEAIKKARKDFRDARELFHKLLPVPWMEFLKYCATEIPKEKFQELVQESKIGLAEAREETIKIWNKNLESIFSLIKKQFQKSITPSEIETRVSALIDLLKDAALFVTEELRAIDTMEAGL
ncbi:hypothetical protein KJA15_04060 [Patescibacteria group bacterium]|nr:hypothetical protein [Patescibacteria group bacterium]